MIILKRKINKNKNNLGINSFKLNYIKQIGIIDSKTNEIKGDINKINKYINANLRNFKY